MQKAAEDLKISSSHMIGANLVSDQLKHYRDTFPPEMYLSHKAHPTLVKAVRLHNGHIG